MTLEFAIEEIKRMAEGYTRLDGYVDVSRMRQEDKGRYVYYMAVKRALSMAIFGDFLDVSQARIDYNIEDYGRLP